MAEKKTVAEKIASKNSVYQILSHQSGNALTVENASTESGALLTVDAPDKENASQTWRIVPESNGACKIINAASQKAIDVINGSTENGAWLHQWNPCETDTQLWEIVPTSAGYYKVISKASGKALDIVDISHEVGAHVQIWESASGENQEWRFRKLTSAEEAKKKPAAKHRRGCGRKSVKKRAAVSPTSSVTEKPAEAAKPAVTIQPEKAKTIVNSEPKKSVLAMPSDFLSKEKK